MLFMLVFFQVVKKFFSNSVCVTFLNLNLTNLTNMRFLNIGVDRYA